MSIRDILQVNVHLHVLSLVPNVFSPGTQFLGEAFSSDFLLQSDRSAEVHFKVFYPLLLFLMLRSHYTQSCNNSRDRQWIIVVLVCRRRGVLHDSRLPHTWHPESQHLECLLGVYRYRVCVTHSPSGTLHVSGLSELHHVHM